jgi:hypothetical protein
MSDSIIYVRRKGTQDDPYISIMQDLIVKDGKVQLQEIPDDFTHVLVTNPNAPEETYYEIYSGTPNTFQYLVDYNTFGFVLFNNEDNNKELRFQYKGTGIFYLPAGRVWTKESGGDVIETLQDIIDTEVEAIGHLEELNTLVTNAETATNNANIATANTNDAISNANNATINANNAADNANNKAELANTATINANNATTLANNAATNANDKASLADTATINANNAANNANTKAELADLAATNAQEVADNYVSRGEYNGGTQYYKGNEVYNSGSSYRAKEDTIGNAPPAYPIVENDYWITTAIKGSDGAGGDMFRTTYDTNMDGKVNSADVADSVPWSGITSKPSTFTPSAHEHNADEINIIDAGSIITATNVEDALQESFNQFGILSNLNTSVKTDLVSGINSHLAEIATVYLAKYAPADGSGDATPGYNQAISDLASQGGGQIFAKGTFRFDSRPNALSGGVSLVGAGINNTILQKNYVESEPTNGFITIGTPNGGTEIKFLSMQVLESGGAAISVIPTAEASSNFLNFSELYITGPDALKLWDYGLYMDGSLKATGAEGVRNIKVSNTEIYRTALSTAYFKGYAGVAMTKCGLYGTGGVSRLDIDGASFASSYFNGDFTYCEKVYVAQSGGVNHVTLSCPQFLEIHNTVNAVNMQIFGKVSDVKEYNNIMGNGLYVSSNGIEGKGGFINFWNESPNGLTKIAHSNAVLPGFSLANGQTVTFNITRAKMFWISDGGARDALIFADQTTEAISILANPSARYENSATPASGKIGIWKAAASHTINIKNNTGSSRTLYIFIVGASAANMTDPV